MWRAIRNQLVLRCRQHGGVVGVSLAASADFGDMFKSIVSEAFGRLLDLGSLT